MLIGLGHFYFLPTFLENLELGSKIILYFNKGKLMQNSENCDFWSYKETY